MLRKFPNATIGSLFCVLLGLGVLQGQRVHGLLDAEAFYRWMLSASNQVRVFGVPGHVPSGEDPARYRDKELFAKLVEESEHRLPDVPVTEKDYDATGKVYPKVVRYTSVPLDPKKEFELEGEKGAIDSEEQRQREWELWALARSPEMAALRSEFVTALKEGRITSLGSTFGMEGLYTTQGTNISLANMFFGFRKMAANLVWLEVDKYWHKGEMHRMIPLMKTCVTLDPTFIDAFLLGAWHLAYNATAQFTDTPWELRHYEPRYETWIGQKETYYFSAIEYLKDGIRKNPRNYKLYFDLGYAIYEEKLANHPEAIKYLDEAIRLDHDRWVRRQLYRVLGLNGQFEESKRGWENYHQWQPANTVAPRFINLMEGEIKDRDAHRLTVQANAAERLAEFATQRGDTAAAADWAAKARTKREEAARKYEEAKNFWQGLVHADQEVDSYAYARVLRAKAAELREQGRYEEAISYLEEARWQSNEFWDAGTDLILQYKQEANLPLQVTETRYLERKAKTLEYTRHLPKSMGGRMYRFAEGQWRGAGYPGEGAEPVRQDSEEYFKLLWERPEVEEIIRRLDGNVILAAGDRWYEYLSNTPPTPSKLYDPDNRLRIG